MLRRASAIFFVIALASCRSAQNPTAPCAEGSALVLGACVPWAVADSFCGPASKPTTGGGCARKTCALGEALDVDHGLCLPESGVVRTLMRGPPREDEPRKRGACMYGVLESRGGQLICAAGAASCGGGERYVKPAADAGVNLELAGRCEATPACALGELFNEATSKCERVVRNGVVDIGTWARLAIGTDGAEGTNAFCAPVRATGARGRFQIELGIPNNDVTQVTPKLISRPGTPPGTGDAATKSLVRLVETLRFYGGSTLAATVSLEVACSGGEANGNAHPTLDFVQDSLDGGR